MSDDSIGIVKALSASVRSAVPCRCSSTQSHRIASRPTNSSGCVDNKRIGESLSGETEAVFFAPHIEAPAQIAADAAASAQVLIQDKVRDGGSDMSPAGYYLRQSSSGTVLRQQDRPRYPFF